jgi:hypothetical protein
MAYKILFLVEEERNIFQGTNKENGQAKRIGVKRVNVTLWQTVHVKNEKECETKS